MLHYGGSPKTRDFAFPTALASRQRQDMNSEQSFALRQLFYGQTNAPGAADFEGARKEVKTVATGSGVLSESEQRCLLARMSASGTPPDMIQSVMSWNERAESAAEMLARVGARASQRWQTEAWILYEALSVAEATAIALELTLAWHDSARGITRISGGHPPDLPAQGRKRLRCGLRAVPGPPLLQHRHRHPSGREHDAG